MHRYPGSTVPGFLDRLRDGSASAVAELYQKYGLFLAEVFQHHGVREADLDDQLQELVLKMLRVLQKAERVEGFRAWLYVAARRASIDYLRRTKGKKNEVNVAVGGTDFLELVQAVAAPDLDAVGSLAADEARMGVLIAELERRLTPRECRILHGLLAGRSQAEVAAELGLSEMSVSLIKRHRIFPAFEEEAAKLMG